MDLTAGDVVDFGKIVYVRKNHAIPALPDMNLIILKKEGVYQAICIDIEIDAIGGSINECCDGLKKTLMSYTMQMVDNYSGNVKKAVEDIVNVAYSPGNAKAQLFTRYLETF